VVTVYGVRDVVASGKKNHDAQLCVEVFSALKFQVASDRGVRRALPSSPVTHTHMPAFGSSSNTGRLPAKKPRCATGEMTPSSSARSRTSSRSYSPRTSSSSKERAPAPAPGAANNRVSKRKLVPTTPSPPSTHALTAGRDTTKHPASVRNTAPRGEVRTTTPTPASPSRPGPGGAFFSSEKKKNQLYFGIAAVRNLLFEEGPRSCCAVESPPSTPKKEKVGSGSKSDADTSLEINRPRELDIELAPRYANALAVDRAAGAVAAPARFGDRATHLHLADDLWRSVAGRIFGTTSGAHGDQLAVLACGVFRRLGDALPESESDVLFSGGDDVFDERSRSRLDRHAGDVDFDTLVPLLKRGVSEEDTTATVRRKTRCGWWSQVFVWASSRQVATVARNSSGSSANRRNGFHKTRIVAALFSLGVLAFVMPLVVLPVLDGNAFWDKDSEGGGNAPLTRGEGTRGPPPK
jgi:hypothetical protein